MNKKIKITFIIFPLMLIGYGLMPSKIDFSLKEKISDQITNKVIEDLTNRTALRSIGTGGGMLYDIEMLAISFEHNQTLEIEEARKLIIQFTSHCVNLVF